MVVVRNEYCNQCQSDGFSLVRNQSLSVVAHKFAKRLGRREVAEVATNQFRCRPCSSTEGTHAG